MLVCLQLQCPRNLNFENLRNLLTLFDCPEAVEPWSSPNLNYVLVSLGCHLCFDAVGGHKMRLGWCLGSKTAIEGCSISVHVCGILMCDV
jgi:hypothetical protein